MSNRTYFVHESSYVDEPCEIGAGTTIWHFSHVMKNCRVGQKCNIGQNVVISPDVVIGNNVKIQNNVSIYTGCILEDNVFCGPSMVFTNVVNPRSHVARKNEYKTRESRKYRGRKTPQCILLAPDLTHAQTIGIYIRFSREFLRPALVGASKPRGDIAASARP